MQKLFYKLNLDIVFNWFAIWVLTDNAQKVMQYMSALLFLANLIAAFNKLSWFLWVDFVAFDLIFLFFFFRFLLKED